MEGFRIKKQDELEDQTEMVSDVLGQAIVPQSLQEDIKSMSINDLKIKFPVRYDMYVKILKARKNDREISDNDIREMTDQLTALNNLDTYITNHQFGIERTLRERQFSVFEDLRLFMEKGGKEGYIKLPTGSGKTVIFSEFIEAIGLKTLIVVPKRFLVDQTADRLSKFAKGLDVGKIYSHSNSIGKDVTVITYQSLIVRIGDGSLNPADYPCLILDEAHESDSVKRQATISMFENSLKIAFSATFTEDTKEFFPTKIHSLGVKEAAEDGVVSPFSVIIVKTHVDLDHVRIKDSGEYDEDELRQAINIRSRNQAAVDVYKKMFDGELAVAYCMGVKHAEEVAVLCRENGIPSASINGKTAKAEQKDIIERFKSGEIKVLCNADLLIAGFDEEKASVCLNLRPTLSAIVAEQRGGRVLRLDPNNEAKHSTIVDFVDDSGVELEKQPITFAQIANTAMAYRKNLQVRLPKKDDEGAIEERPVPNIEGIEIITDPQEVMRVIKNKIDFTASVEQAPEGWVTKNFLSVKFHVDRSKIADLAKPYRVSHPEWFHNYKSQNGEAEFISSELVAIISDNLGKRERTPHGWMTLGGLAKSLVRSNTNISEIAAQYRPSHPEWFKNYIPARGPIAEHIAPELVTIIKDKLSEIPFAPEGWLNLNQLGAVVDASEHTLNKLVSAYRATKPDWYKVYRALAGTQKRTEHFSPELVKKIKDDFKKPELAPEGWVSLNDLRVQFSVGKNTIKRITDPYRITRPEWFHEYKKSSGPSSEHYSPELIQEMTRQLRK